MTHSRNKGRNAEAEAEKILRTHGFQTERNLGGRVQVAGDIAIYEPSLAVEVRRREQLQVVKWCREHEASTPPSHTPVLVFRPNREPWRVALLLEDFARLVKR